MALMMPWALLAGLFAGVFAEDFAPELVNDEPCDGAECGLEMLHLRARKVTQELGEASTSSENEEADASISEASTEADSEEQAVGDDGRHCTHYVSCHNGFYHGVKCSGGRYCTKWGGGGGGGGGGRTCRKYVNCRSGFYNGINCHGSRYCVTWGLLQEGEEEKDADSENEAADASISEASTEADSEEQAVGDDGRHCTHYVSCHNGFYHGVKCSGGRYCTKWGGGGGGGGGGRTCRKYVNCRSGFYNGINCHGSRYCVSWGLLQEGEEEKDADSQNEEADSSSLKPADFDAQS